MKLYKSCIPDFLKHRNRFHLVGSLVCSAKQFTITILYPNESNYTFIPLQLYHLNIPSCLLVLGRLVCSAKQFTIKMLYLNETNYTGIPLQLYRLNIPSLAGH